MDRREILNIRNQLTKEAIRKNSKCIVDSLYAYLSPVTALYLPYGSEVDVTAILKKEDIRFCIPKTCEDYTLKFFYLEKDTVLKKSALGILEPINATLVDKKDIGTIVIPIVAFDHHKHRLGHGRGYYDRYLQDYTGLKVGVAFSCQRMEYIKAMPHDVAMDIILTEDVVYK